MNLFRDTNGLKELKGIVPSEKSDKAQQSLHGRLEKERQVLKGIACEAVGTKNLMNLLGEVCCQNSHEPRIKEIVSVLSIRAGSRKFLAPKSAYSPVPFSEVAHESNRKGRTAQRFESRVVYNHGLQH